MTFDPFQLESGLIGNVDITVTDAAFTHRLEAFDPTKLELHLTVEVQGDDGGEQVIYLGCGDGWETNDDGATATREDGKERNFHQNTKVGEFFAGLVKVMGEDAAADKAIRGRVQEFPTGPREAGFWKGLQLHVARESRKGGGEISDYDVLVIDGFNGIQGAGGTKATAKKAAAPAKKAAKKAAPAAKEPTPSEVAAGGLTDEIRAKLDDIADESADHDSFMEAAMAAIPEASTDDAVKAAIADDGEGSIWKDAVARYEASVAQG